TINDTQFTLDTITVDAIKALGYEIDDYSYVEGEPYSVEAGDYETISLYDDNVCGIYLYFKNNTSEAIDITECDIIGIDFGQNYEMLFEGGCHCPFTFMGLSAGATASDVEQVLGTPDGYSEYDTSVDYYYYLSDEGDSQLIVTIEESVGMTDIDFYNNLWD
ncbi:MAG: hypothetical protein IJ958_06535, partial [Agathobacter sp.]|nr:hypothetical protein [Agathobacter sp.]